MQVKCPTCGKMTEISVKESFYYDFEILGCDSENLYLNLYTSCNECDDYISFRTTLKLQIDENSIYDVCACD